MPSRPKTFEQFFLTHRTTPAELRDVGFTAVSFNEAGKALHETAARLGFRPYLCECFQDKTGISSKARMSRNQKTIWSCFVAQECLADVLRDGDFVVELRLLLESPVIEEDEDWVNEARQACQKVLAALTT